MIPKYNSRKSPGNSLCDTEESGALGAGWTLRKPAMASVILSPDPH